MVWNILCKIVCKSFFIKKERKRRFSSLSGIPTQLLAMAIPCHPLGCATAQRQRASPPSPEPLTLRTHTSAGRGHPQPPASGGRAPPPPDPALARTLMLDEPIQALLSAPRPPLRALGQRRRRPEAQPRRAAAIAAGPRSPLPSISSAAAT
jgi:hypothetical protein